MKRKFENHLDEELSSKRYNRKRLYREEFVFSGGSASGDEESNEEGSYVKKLKLTNKEAVLNRIYNFKKIDKNNIPSYIK
jgi:hypothetical protein